MQNIDELVRKATPEQRTVLSRLQGLVGEEKRLIEEARWKEKVRNEGLIFSYSTYNATDKDVESALNNNSFNIPEGTRRRWKDVQGKIKKAVEDATKYGVLVVPYNSLK